jgi:hypothetical protein
MQTVQVYIDVPSRVTHEHVLHLKPTSEPGHEAKQTNLLHQRKHLYPPAIRSMHSTTPTASSPHPPPSSNASARWCRSWPLARAHAGQVFRRTDQQLNEATNPTTTSSQHSTCAQLEPDGSHNKGASCLSRASSKSRMRPVIIIPPNPSPPQNPPPPIRRRRRRTRLQNPR